jgi:hypothetical protein
VPRRPGSKQVVELPNPAPGRYLVVVEGSGRRSTNTVVVE